ncbi:MAG: hypothetical protein LBI68_03910 [Azoarcus sp.]|jgi:hypothetical protein|nr:hypothetical protein [Azoarcus sp.]
MTFQWEYQHQLIREKTPEYSTLGGAKPAKKSPAKHSGITKKHLPDR